jgi:hypothetical protein
MALASFIILFLISILKELSAGFVKQLSSLHSFLCATTLIDELLS